MADRISKEKRSWNMSRIRGQETSLEVMVRSYLFRKGFRFRKNVKNLPGKPDVVLPKYKTVIFINGCFWHHHEGCSLAVIPKTRTDFWMEKFRKNRQNDKNNGELLEKDGWTVITLWECTIKKDFFRTMESVESRICEKEPYKI
ncbi:MAG: very short patch repair endonuclease [Succinivibrio sp.]